MTRFSQDVLVRFQLAVLSNDDAVFLSPDNITQLAWAERLGGAIRIPTVSW